MKIALLGAGKMGAWLAAQLASEHETAIYDPDVARAGSVRVARTLRRLEELRDFAPQLLVNAASLVHTIPAFEAAVPHLNRDCILADIASVKGDIPAYYAGCGFRFASVHPMFGPTFANLDALRRENAILISESEPSIKRLFRDLFARLGLTIFEYSFAEHDTMMAYSLSTPFACTMAFAACIHRSVVPGTTFAKHLEIARGLLSEDDDLILRILFNSYSVSQLAGLADNLSRLREIVEAKDAGKARELLAILRRNVA